MTCGSGSSSCLRQGLICNNVPEYQICFLWIQKQLWLSVSCLEKNSVICFHSLTPVRIWTFYCFTLCCIGYGIKLFIVSIQGSVCSFCLNELFCQMKHEDSHCEACWAPERTVSCDVRAFWFETEMEKRQNLQLKGCVLLNDRWLCNNNFKFYLTALELIFCRLKRQVWVYVPVACLFAPKIQNKGTGVAAKLRTIMVPQQQK